MKEKNNPPDENDDSFITCSFNYSLPRTFHRKNNPPMESITMEGTGGVTLQPQQFRFDIYKGKHSINFVEPDNGGDQKALGLKMAKLMVSRLP